MNGTPDRKEGRKKVSYEDLPGYGSNIFFTIDYPAMIVNKASSQNRSSFRGNSSSNDVSMDWDASNAEEARARNDLARFDHANEQAIPEAPNSSRNTHFDDFDSRTPRRIRAHRRRRAPYRDHDSAHRPPNSRIPRRSIWYGDVDNPRVDHYSPPPRGDDSEDSPEILRQRTEALIAAAMADMDVRDDREDRRDRGGYRGSSKRRRDGKLASLLVVMAWAQVWRAVLEDRRFWSLSLLFGRSATLWSDVVHFATAAWRIYAADKCFNRMQMMATTTTVATTGADPSDAATTILPVVDTKSRRFLSYVDCS